MNNVVIACRHCTEHLKGMSMNKVENGRLSIGVALRAVGRGKFCPCVWLQVLYFLTRKLVGQNI